MAGLASSQEPSPDIIGEAVAGDFLYVFLDEGGNFDFSPSGTRFFTLTSVTKRRPFRVSPELDGLKYNLIEEGLDLEYFHATEDRQRVRDRVFSIIQSQIGMMRVDSLIVEKRKTGPALRDPEHFYPRMLGYLLRYLFQGLQLDQCAEVLVITDQIPVAKKRKAVEKAAKATLKAMLPHGCRFRVMHHASKSTFGLQVADYCNWAIFRKWERGDERSHALIREGIASEFDIFQAGRRLYY
ncbi:MAG: DUF3800 domain-containing protein [Deltaproteobacteria bacterium]|nr:DUF3800 domain-containing protein [Deltaproteobacteria bacterium]